MSETTTSGNRWEPGQQTYADAPPPHVPAPATDPNPPAETSPPAGTSPTKPGLGDRARAIPRSALLAAAASFLVVVVGIGGFFLGRATAPEGGGDGTTPTGFDPNGGPGQFRDFDGDGQPDGQGGRPGFGQGTVPGTGTNSGSGTGTGTPSAWYVVPTATDPAIDPAVHAA